MKQAFTIVLTVLLTAALLGGCSAEATPAVAEVQTAPQSSQTDMGAAANLILDIPTTQYFTKEAVPQEDMDTTADTYAAATARNPLAEIVTYLNP